ncbi:hypothetical protein HU200_015849 [Digitaria exilis]|uniref:Uncharacterized protein n=1 Tax=Digitaria exilis TaxID=1010633 RepID=A0A835F8Y8_9POAL|nr:hypothetical protein HU200_015849 [Digitaria exilis]
MSTSDAAAEMHALGKEDLPAAAEAMDVGRSGDLGLFPFLCVDDDDPFSRPGDLAISVFLTLRFSPPVATGHDIGLFPFLCVDDDDPFSRPGDLVGGHGNLPVRLSPSSSRSGSHHRWPRGMTE